MMRLSPLSAREISRRLLKLGFILARKRGSHTMWQHSDGRCTVLPVHKGEDIGRGLLKSILRDINIHWEEFREL
jgi:predicted RNA binding protein YcfA (HicA-like mRNA interferase family)